MTPSISVAAGLAGAPAAIDVASIPPISRDESTRVATMEYARFSELVQQLRPDEFTLPTDCPEWDVRTMIVHQCGAGEGHSRWTEFLRQMILGLRLVKGRELVDGLNDFHLRERADWTGERAVAALPEVQARAVQGRRKFPALLRWIPVSSAGVKGFSMGFLYDVILTRDTWMHRVDISRATGRPMVLTAEHDGRIVADVVADWARQHGKSFELRLGGPAGGDYRQGSAGPELTMDAVEFCRTISGRERGAGLLAQQVVW